MRSSQRWRFGDGGELALIRFDGWKKSGVVNSPVEGTVGYPAPLFTVVSYIQTVVGLGISEPPTAAGN